MNERPDGYTCNACGIVLKTESGFLKHKCKNMQREEDLRSIDGQIAYEYYSRWILQKKKGSHTLKTFGDSRYFNSLIKFTRWTRRVNIPDVNRYISYMILQHYDPPMWTDDKVYVQYIQHLDKMSSVDDHVKYTLKTLETISRRNDCSISEALSTLATGDLLKLVTQRKLSPWVLIHTTIFKDVVSSLSLVDKTHFVNTIRPKFWKTHIENNPVESEEIKLVCEALHL